jgi:hypothetical protein
MHYFVQRPLYVLWCTSPSFTFIESFIFFDFFFLQVFGHLLGPRSSNSLIGPLIRKQIYLPIAFNGIGFISTTTIALTTYLMSWALVTLIIVVRFMVDQHPFLFDALTQVDNDTFFFQQHLKATCDFLSPSICMCLTLFD